VTERPAAVNCVCVGGERLALTPVRRLIVASDRRRYHTFSYYWWSTASVRHIDDVRHSGTLLALSRGHVVVPRERV